MLLKFYIFRTVMTCSTARWFCDTIKDPWNVRIVRFHELCWYVTQPVTHAYNNFNPYRRESRVQSIERMAFEGLICI
jgi:hypothetical protein